MSRGKLVAGAAANTQLEAYYAFAKGRKLRE
jgi:hypothetical protein